MPKHLNSINTIEQHKSLTWYSKRILIFLLNICCLSTLGQTQKLYYSGTSPDRIGVRSTTGKIILAEIYLGPTFDGSDVGDTIYNNEIILHDAKGNVCVFNLLGKFLYHPFIFDLGPDYWQDGFRRTTENGKIGFASMDGKYFIPAKFNFAYPFHNGKAVVCFDCISKLVGEHQISIGSNYGLINKKGQLLKRINKSEINKYISY